MKKHVTSFLIMLCAIAPLRVLGQTVSISVKVVGGCYGREDIYWLINFGGNDYSRNGIDFTITDNISNPGVGTAHIELIGPECNPDYVRVYVDESFDLTNSNCWDHSDVFYFPDGTSVVTEIKYRTPRLNTPVISGVGSNEIICQSVEMNTSGSATEYVWLVSDSETSGFRVFERSSIPKISVEGSMLESFEFIGEKLFFKVDDSVCPEKASGISSGYSFASPPPKFADLTATNISCYGDQSGEILIDNIRYSDNSIYTGGTELYITILGPGNIQFGYDNFIGTELRIDDNMVKDLYHESAGMIPGTWKFTVENGTGCGAYSWGSVIVEGPAGPITTAKAGSDEKICGATATLAANAVDATDETGKWSVVSGSGTFQNDNSRTSTVSGLAPGVNAFRWTITQNYGCVSYDDVVIDRLNISTPNAGIDKRACEASIVLNANVPGTGEYGIWTVITGSGVITNTNQQNTTVTGLSDGINTFRWTIQDNDNVCSKADEVIITYTKVTIAEAGSDQRLCTSSTFLSANVPKDGETGEWALISGSGTFSNKHSSTSKIENLSEGTNIFRWTISDITGQCNSTADAVSITLTDLHISEVMEKRKHPSCTEENDGKIVIIGTGGIGFAGLDYEFNLSNGDQAYGEDGEEVTFSGLPAGLYTVTITDSECTKSYEKAIQLIAPQPLVATFTETSISCHGSTNGSLNLTPSGGTSPYTFLWSNNATTEDLSNIGAGDYSVTITDAKGCTLLEPYTLTEPFALQANAITSNYNGAGVSCHDAVDGTIDIAVTGGTAPYNFLWSNGEITEDLLNLSPGFYSVEITDLNGCTKSLTNIEIINPPLLELAITEKINVDCNGNATGSIKVSASGGVVNESYEYSIDGITWQTSGNFTNLSARIYTIYVRDANGCTAAISTTITEPGELSGGVLNVVMSTCGEHNGSAEAHAAGGTQPYSYTWYNSSDMIVANTALLSGVGGGIYRVLISDAHGCSVTNSANISSVDGAKIIDADIVSASCFDSSDGQATLVIEGSAPFNVLWENGETGATATALHSGNNAVTITDANGCVVIEEIIIPAPEPLNYTIINALIPSCYDSQDGSLTIAASGGSGEYTYAWANGTMGNILNNIPSGNYALIIRDSNGCTLEAEVSLDGVDPLQINLESSTLPTCVGDANGRLIVAASGGNGQYNYNWSTGAAGAVLNQIGSGAYEVEVTDGKGCSFSGAISLPDPKPFTIDIGVDVEICTGSAYAISAPLANAATYSWTADNGFSSSDREVILSEGGIYNLHVTNQNGCEAEDNFVLTVSDNLLDADFLMATEAYVGDTIVIIDISWPIPDDLIWNFGDEATILMENQDYAEVVFQEPGVYAVDIAVELADCQDFYSQVINILGEGEKNNHTRRISANEDLIHEFNIFPNPGDGFFKVEIELSQKKDVRLAMVDLRGNRIVLDRHYKGKQSYVLAISLPKLKTGIYLLTLQTGGRTSMLRVMVR